MTKLIVPKRRLITRRRFLAGAGSSILLPAMPRAASAVYCAPSSLFVDSGRQPFWGINFTSYVNASGTDGPYGTGVTDSDRYDQTACDNIVGDLKQIGYDLVAVQMMPGIANGSDAIGPGPRSETRAGIRRACNNVVNNGMTLAVKIQPETTDASNRTTTWQPSTPSGFGANYKTWGFALLDDIEANLPTGKHITGLILMSECDQVCTSTYVSMFQSIKSGFRSRYPHLRWIVNMPTSIGGTGFGGFARAPQSYRQIFDAECCDAYIPTRTDAETGPLTAATYIDRYSNPAANHAHGGPGDFIANNAPPVGLQNTSWPTFLSGICTADNLPFIDAEAGCPASVSSTLGAVSPASDGAGGAATANGVTEQLNYHKAIYNTAKTVSNYAGVIFHEITSIGDIIGSFLGTDGFRIQQMKQLMLLHLQNTGGSYGTFSPSNPNGSPPRGLSFVTNS